MSGNHVTVPTGAALRVKALETILEEKGLVNSAALDSVVDTFETKVGPRNGAWYISRAGQFKNDPVYEEIVSRGRDYRRSLRPKPRGKKR